MPLRCLRVRGPAAQEYHFLLGGWKNGWCGIYDDAPGRLRGLAVAPFGIETNRWYAIRIRLRGPSIDCFLDGKKVFYGFDELYDRGQIGFRIHSDFHIRNIKVARPDGTTLLAGLPNLAQAGDPIRSQTAADSTGPSAPLRFQPSVPTSEVAPQRWRYTTAQPGDNWAKETFDDSKWESGGGGFGVSAPSGPVPLRHGTPEAFGCGATSNYPLGLSGASFASRIAGRSRSILTAFWQTSCRRPKDSTPLPGLATRPRRRPYRGTQSVGRALRPRSR